MAIGVDEDGYREVIGAAEGMKEDKESWRGFLVWLKSRGLNGVKLVVGDKNLGMCESVHEELGDSAIRDNRRLLYRVMTEAGFTNYPLEWWHYDYGDSFWGYYTHKPSIYRGITGEAIK